MTESGPHRGKINSLVIVLYINTRDRLWVLVTISKSWKELWRTSVPSRTPPAFLVHHCGFLCSRADCTRKSTFFPSRHSVPSTWSLILQVLNIYYKLTSEEALQFSLEFAWFCHRSNSGMAIEAAIALI